MVVSISIVGNQQELNAKKNVLLGTSIEKAINHRASVVIDETIEADMEENMKKANITELYV